MESHQPSEDLHDTAFIFAGGDEVAFDPAMVDSPGALVIAADSGLDYAHGASIAVDLAIGDMDSVTPAALRRAAEVGTEIDTHPVDKDVTDLELALDAVVERGRSRVVIIGGGGGRLSHLLGNASLVAAERYRHLSIDWRMGSTLVSVAVPGRRVAVNASPHALVSLVPVEPCSGVTTGGLVWRLENADLEPGSSRGISNRLVGTAGWVSIRSGALLVVVERGNT